MRKMAAWWIVLCMGVLITAALLTGCAKGEVKPLEQPLVVTAFRYEHHGMRSAEFYTMELEAAEDGTHVALSLNGGAHKADRRARDGEHFRMTMRLEDGRTITAEGSNAYPE